MHKRQKYFVGLLIVASLFGAAAAFYATLAHYNVASSEFCSVSEAFDCGVVNQSKYSKLFGIPVAMLGLGSYLFFLVAGVAYMKTLKSRILDAMVFTAVVGILFSLYLTYIEAFVLYTWCMLCLASLAAIILVNVAVFGLRAVERKSALIPEEPSDEARSADRVV